MPSTGAQVEPKQTQDALKLAQLAAKLLPTGLTCPKGALRTGQVGPPSGKLCIPSTDVGHRKWFRRPTWSQHGRSESQLEGPGCSRTVPEDSRERSGTLLGSFGTLSGSPRSLFWTAPSSSVQHFIEKRQIVLEKYADFAFPPIGAATQKCVFLQCFLHAR